MARGRFINKDVAKRVRRLYYNHPSYTASKIRDEVNKEIRKQDNAIDSKWPGLSAVQKIIQSLKKESFLDKEWTVQSLSTSEIAAEALPKVLDAYGMTVAWGLEKRLTVREAKWVGRLYHVLTDIQELTIAARECAMNEMESEPIGDTELSFVDADLMTRAITGKPGVTYKYAGNGNFQFIIHERGVYKLDIQPQTSQDTEPVSKLK
jgi:hypothetical protein